MTIGFRDLDLHEAEAELVGACIDHEVALCIALERLPVDDFRSYRAHDLRRVFYVLAGWLERGAYDPATNRERLVPLWEDLEEGWGYLDSLWCPWGMLPDYVTELCDAITETNRLSDAAFNAARRWENTPLRHHEHYSMRFATSLSNETRPDSPHPAVARKKPPRRGGLGGVSL